MSESLVLGLPNGKACHFTSTAMRTVAKYLRWETFKRGHTRVRVSNYGSTIR
jgi:hypothetical protein